VELAHALDATLESSNLQLSAMLERKLRKNRHPKHAAEVRENLVPVEINHHRPMDSHPARATLFLHEDILARTIDYEEDLYNYRVAELNSGRSDPGRPEYDEVFGGAPSTGTPHRYHVSNSFPPFIRDMGDEGFKIYTPKDCPGIDDPANQNNFPIINTLLSIPFSLLHNIARLIGIVPLTFYEQNLITMGSVIIYLWWWDPSLEMLKLSEENRVRNVAANQQDDNRNPQPPPIHHPSRSSVTWQTKLPDIKFNTVGNSASDNHDSPNEEPHIRVTELSLGQILLGAESSFLRDKELLVLGSDELDEMHDPKRTVKDILDNVTSSATSDTWAWEVRTPEGFDDSDSGIEEDVMEKPAVCPLSCDINSWYEKDLDARAEAPLPLIPTPFQKGIVGGSSANDFLMTKGLLDPRIYIKFLDLSSFS